MVALRFVLDGGQMKAGGIRWAVIQGATLGLLERGPGWGSTGSDLLFNVDLRRRRTGLDPYCWDSEWDLHITLYSGVQSAPGWRRLTLPSYKRGFRVWLLDVLSIVFLTWSLGFCVFAFPRGVIRVFGEEAAHPKPVSWITAEGEIKRTFVNGSQQREGDAK